MIAVVAARVVATVLVDAIIDTVAIATPLPLLLRHCPGPEGVLRHEGAGRCDVRD